MLTARFVPLVSETNGTKAGRGNGEMPTEYLFYCPTGSIFYILPDKGIRGYKIAGQPAPRLIII
jgi:hypothetical protein